MYIVTFEYRNVIIYQLHKFAGLIFAVDVAQRDVLHHGMLSYMQRRDVRHFFGATHLAIVIFFASDNLLDSVYRRLSQDSAPDSDATNLHSSKKRCRIFRIAGSNSPPAF